MMKMEDLRFGSKGETVKEAMTRYQTFIELQPNDSDNEDNDKISYSKPISRKELDRIEKEDNFPIPEALKTFYTTIANGFGNVYDQYGNSGFMIERVSDKYPFLNIRDAYFYTLFREGDNSKKLSDKKIDTWMQKHGYDFDSQNYRVFGYYFVDPDEMYLFVYDKEGKIYVDSEGMQPGYRDINQFFSHFVNAVINDKIYRYSDRHQEWYISPSLINRRMKYDGVPLSNIQCQVDGNIMLTLLTRIKDQKTLQTILSSFDGKVPFYKETEEQFILYHEGDLTIEGDLLLDYHKGWKSNDKEWFDLYNIHNGLYIEKLSQIEEGVNNPLQEAGLKVGDIITTVNNKPTPTIDHLDRILKSTSNPVIDVTYLSDGKEKQTKVSLYVKDGIKRIGAYINYIELNNNIPIQGLYINGSLTIIGNIINNIEEGGPFLVVKNKLQANNVILGGSYIYADTLHINETLTINGNDGKCKIGNIQAANIINNSLRQLPRQIKT